MYRRTVVEINLSAIRENISSLKKHLGGGVKILLPVKADAYGHGIIRVSQYVEKKGLADMLGVASLDEGIELREAGVSLPILVLGLILPEQEQIEVLLEKGLSQTVADTAIAEKISAAASAMDLQARLHLKIDTGMGRIGCRPEEAVDTARKIASLKNVLLEGIYSHFPDADSSDHEFTLEQIRVMSTIIHDLERDGLRTAFRHISNSAGIINYPDTTFNMVRPGIIAYGYLPSPELRPSFTIVPSMTMKSTVMFFKRVPSGTPLSYGRTYTAYCDQNIATVPAGYGDGYSRALSNRGKVIIAGKVYPVVGRVSMDQILVNLGDDVYPPGQEVILFGGDTITVDTVASWIGTIPYEVTCGISKRVPRIYIE